MEVIAAHHYLARIVELCCQILSSLKIMNYTYDLRVMVQLPTVDMKLSGLHHPPVRHLYFSRQSNTGTKNIRHLIEKGH